MSHRLISNLVDDLISSPPQSETLFIIAHPLGWVGDDLDLSWQQKLYCSFGSEFLVDEGGW
jgi:hypothetical protein